MDPMQAAVIQALMGAQAQMGPQIPIPPTAAAALAAEGRGGMDPNSPRVRLRNPRRADEVMAQAGGGMGMDPTGMMPQPMPQDGGAPPGQMPPYRGPVGFGRSARARTWNDPATQTMDVTPGGAAGGDYGVPTADMGATMSALGIDPDLEISRAAPGSRSAPGMYGAAPDGRTGNSRGGMIAEATTPGNPGQQPAQPGGGMGFGVSPDLDLFLMRLGLGMAQASDRPGATLLGSLGAGGMGAVAGQQQDRRLALTERATAARERLADQREERMARSGEAQTAYQNARLAQGERAGQESRDLRRDESTRREQADAQRLFTHTLDLATKPKALDGVGGGGGLGLDPSAAHAYALDLVSRYYPQSSFARDKFATDLAARVNSGEISEEQAALELRKRFSR